MKRDAADWQDQETLILTPREEKAAATSAPALTILAHPDPSRVGERSVLTELSADQVLRVSRLEPLFRAPGHPPSRARALQDPHLSRQPIHIYGSVAGSVVVDRAACSTAVSIDGYDIFERRGLGATAIERGVPVILGTAVALLLHRLPQPLPEEAPGLGLVGESAGIAELRRELRRLAPLDLPVLLRGETGTGKELAARALHDEGSRRAGPFVAVNMATLPPTLAAAELFGSARGAYTGADRAKTGLFEQARGGTLFLDEIGETPAEVQPMLLRALESGEIRPVGGDATRVVDVRLVAATDADLEAAIRGYRFRAPLYHRLAGCSIRLPALRERRDDLGRLLAFFLAEEFVGLDETLQPDVPAWPSAEVVARLARHDWPGNVRELRHVARQLVLAGRELAPAALAARVEEMLAPRGIDRPQRPEAPAPTVEEPARIPPRRRMRKIAEVGEDELLAALEAHRYKLQPTARALGVSRINLYRLIERTPSVRKAADLGRAEIQDALARLGDDLETAADTLRVSLKGLKLRMKSLGVSRAATLSPG